MPTTSRLLLVLALVLPLASAADLDQDLLDPSAANIPAAELEAARVEAVSNGLLAIFERMHALGNTKHWYYPPIEQSKITHYEEKKVPARREKRTRNKVRHTYKEVERLVPIKDEYGTITGYEKKKSRVVTGTQVVGKETYEVLVADPNGSEFKTVRTPVRGKGPKLIPTGWYAVNGMALWCLAKAGFESRPDVERFALYLRWLTKAYGLPDHTFDLAWIAIAFAEFENEQLAETAGHAIGKLLDGAYPEERGNPASGLWGPVAIDGPVLARFFQIEMELRRKYDEFEAEVQKLKGARQQRAVQARDKVSKVLNEVLEVLALVTQHGKRIEGPTKALIDDSYEITGLPFAPYNRRLGDTDGTFAAALAIDRFARLDRLPEASPTHKPGGFTVVRGERTRDILADAVAGLLAHQREHGGFDAIASTAIETAFDRMVLPGVPREEPWPELHHDETWRSNLHGYGALLLLGRHVERPPRDFATALQRAEIQARESLEAALAVTDWSKWPGQALHTAPPISPEELAEAPNHRLPVPAWQRQEIAELVAGIVPDPYELVLGGLALQQPLDPAGDLRHIGLGRRLTYRLIRLQGGTGMWGRSTPQPYGRHAGEYGMVIHDREVAIGSKTKRRAQAGRGAGGKGKDKDAKGQNNRNDPTRSLFWDDSNRNHKRTVDQDVFATAASLVYLMHGRDESLPLDEETIDAAIEAFEAAQREATEAAIEAAGEEGAEPPEPPTNLPRTNSALPDLYAAILRRFGRALTPQPEAAEAPAADTPAAGDDSEAPPAGETEEPAPEPAAPDADAALEGIMGG